MTKLKFTKMHGAGNDFVVIDGVRQEIYLTPEQLRLIADRHFGIGCDQILIVKRSNNEEADFRYLIFNADGGEVEQCGNGARCFVRFVHDHKLTSKREIVVETKSGLISPKLEDDGRVTVNMGAPIFESARIPFDSDSDAIIQELEVGGETVQITAVSVGNPHAVQVVADILQAPVATMGPLIENHVRFPKRVNAGFMQVVDRSHIKLRVYERGAGETMSCGTGACAAVVSGIRRGLLDNHVQVATHGGLLTISWAGENAPIMMTGPASTVFEGEINL
ncbi:MAG TPA: diaminopimelate epimerase [Gallionellaceae bacterium]|jgi:diaminopimelate epimerase|nr:MAG: diaminopimelate epimerase [Gallionellales bacterium 24-53-125]OZB09225.1 MAG: diaminopimelate epimerase [Gallionellales bacterium 39-52-133]HQS59175.1 diaminopimelate epimerase [Gallionellaceae bacterium]HQS75911.1 diaminopimelate epimerase [Gallionellaceae bacterium]